MEGKPKTYITDGDPVEVPETAYYVRLIAEGSLLVVKEGQQGRKAPGKGGE
jgi:hypothetical protein